MNAKQTKPTTDEAKAKVASAAITLPDPVTPPTTPYWLLKDSHCKKLGKRSEGGIKYQLLASDDRAVLYVRITANESGGYFSKELVPFSEIEQCLEKCAEASSFPSKAFRDAFVGRSTNNAGFLGAILREEGLLEAAQEEEFQHVLAADIAAWKNAALAPQGTQIAIADPNGMAAFATQSRKTLSVPNKP
jgi:hypothetical protein